MVEILRPIRERSNLATSAATTSSAYGSFAAMSARRLYIFGGIGLIAVGLLFGDIFAVFILHQNADRQGEALLAACRAVAAGDRGAVNEIFARLGSTLED